MLKGGETEIPITSHNNLRIKIFVIGYKNMGESIIILFLDINDKIKPVKYSIVIDSYTLRKKNITDEILRYYSVDTISLLCWTHPHTDHSQGLDFIIKKYCKESTIILIPEHFYNMPSDIVSIKEKSLKQAIERIFSLNRFKRKAVYNVSAIANGYNEVKSLIFKGLDKNVCVSINVVTPNNSILSDFVRNNYKNINKNELSISLIININGYYLYFGGDTPNNHINTINQTYIKNFRFVKIPHHSSQTSEDLLNYLPPHIDTACTTVFKKLPQSSILERYKTKGYIFSTGNNNNNTKYDYGIIEYVYNFSKDLINLDVKLSGNAHIVE